MVARAEAEEKNQFVAIILYGVVVLVGPGSDPHLLLRDVLMLRWCSGAIVGPEASAEPDSQLVSLSQQLSEARHRIYKLETQLVQRQAEINRGISNPILSLR
jgi:hypothetical protein